MLKQKQISVDIPNLELCLLNDSYKNQSLETAIVALIHEKCSRNTSQESSGVKGPLEI